MKSFKQYLEERQIVPGRGKRHGQVIILAGGAGSGKSFAVSQFIASNDYKIINPDDVIVGATKLAQKGKAFPELKGKDLTKPEDLAAVYKDIVVDKRLTGKRQSTFFKNQNPDRLPNVILDRTFSRASEFKTWATKLRNVGYKPENIHIVWVLTDIEIAIAQNKSRGEKGQRTVPKNILIGTHKGTKYSMKDYIFGRSKGAAINGDMFIVFGGAKNTIFYGTPEGELPSGEKPMVVKDFRYMKVKSQGKKFDKTSNIARSLGNILADASRKHRAADPHGLIPDKRTKR